MIKTTKLAPGVTLRCFPDSRFKQGCLSIQFLRPMNAREASMNALLPAVLLRGSSSCPDLRSITQHLDDLYGASVGALVRRVGDYQTTGLCCSFMDDAYALPGDQILAPMMAFLEELLLRPALENGVFRADFVESEKRNLMLTLDAQRNDKRLYAFNRLMELMCKEDSFGIPRLGTKEQIEKIDTAKLYAHYQRILQQSPVQIFYVGAADPEKIAALLQPLVSKIGKSYVNLPPQTALQPVSYSEHTEALDVTQGKLCMGFTTPITLRHPDFAAMQVFNMIFGGGMTSKLFLQVREKRSLCYDISSSYHGSKGILSVSAGIEFDMEMPVRQQILEQLEACRNGDFTDEELTAAKQALISQLQSTHDSPAAIDSYYTNGLLSGLNKTPAKYMACVEAVTARQVMDAARSVSVNTVYFLKGVR